MGARARGVWAFDVGRAALKALKLAPGEDADRVEAEAFAYIEYPKFLSQFDADAEQLVREAMETFLGRNDPGGCKVAISVPGPGCLAKFIKLPLETKAARVREIIGFESRQSMPFALDEAVLDCQVIDDGGDDGCVKVGIFVAQRGLVRRLIRPLTAAGVEVDIVQMGPIALHNFVTFDRISAGGIKGPVVLLDVGADDTALVIADGVRTWQRNVPIGGNHFTLALAYDLRLPFADAEHLKRDTTGTPDARPISTAMRGVFTNFASEVNLTIGFYGSMNKGSKIARVVGLGNGFKLPGLQKFLQQNLTAEVEMLDDFARMTGDEVRGRPDFRDNLPSFAVAYGLGLQALGKAAWRTNLLPPEWRAVRGWSPAAVSARVRRLIRKKPAAGDDGGASCTPWPLRFTTTLPERPHCPACLAEWFPPVQEHRCLTCGWERYPGADLLKWGRVGGCPRCGFTYRWDGRLCFLCRPEKAGPSDREPLGPDGRA